MADMKNHAAEHQGCCCCSGDSCDANAKHDKKNHADGNCCKMEKNNKGTKTRNKVA